jgi:hypothetical protein
MFNKGQCGANKNWRSISKIWKERPQSVATYLIRSVRHFIHGHDKFSKLIYTAKPSLETIVNPARAVLFLCALHFVGTWSSPTSSLKNLFLQNTHACESVEIWRSALSMQR